MNFEQAMDAVRDGQKVTRTKTAVQVIEGIHYLNAAGEPEVVMVYLDRKAAEFGAFQPTQTDKNAQNWRVVEDNPRMVADVEVSEEAAKLVRLSFNPSGNEDVIRVKTLAAAFITAVQAVEAKDGREGALAVTHAQTASMFAVAAITAGL